MIEAGAKSKGQKRKLADAGIATAPLSAGDETTLDSPFGEVSCWPRLGALGERVRPQSRCPTGLPTVSNRVAAPRRHVLSYPWLGCAGLQARRSSPG